MDYRQDSGTRQLGKAVLLLCGQKESMHHITLEAVKIFSKL